MNIKITDDHREMERIGESILQEKPEIYHQNMLNTLQKSIQAHMPDADAQEQKQAMLRSIYDYWVYGNNVEEEFFYHFSEKTHAEKKDYVAFRLREKYCKHLNQNGDASVLVKKYETYLRLRSYYLRDMILIQSDDDYDAFLEFIGKHPSFVVKPADMAFGIGVYLVRKKDYSNPKELFHSIRRSGQKNLKETVWAKNDYIVLEELVEQAPSLSRMHPDSLNVIRATMVRGKDGVHLFHPWIKAGINGSFVATAAQDGFIAEIDAATGKVITEGYQENGSVYITHPNTGVPIKGFQVPNWNEMLELANKLMEEMPEFGYIGWDLALSTKGWCVIEGNYDGEFMYQMINGHGYREEFENLIGWKYEKKFWWE